MSPGLGRGAVGALHLEAFMYDYLIKHRPGNTKEIRCPGKCYETRPINFHYSIGNEIPSFFAIEFGWYCTSTRLYVRRGLKVA